MEYIISIIIGYAFGTLNLANLIAKSKGQDIHDIGTGNPGASNTVINYGWLSGVMVGAHDILKGIIAIFITTRLFDLPYIGVVTGVSAILGHMYPIQMKFKGGKGFATLIGVNLMLNWKLGLFIMVATLVITLITNYIAIATTFSAIFIPSFYFYFSLNITALIFLIATVCILYKHIPNFKKILNGTEVGIWSTFKKKS